MRFRKLISETGAVIESEPLPVLTGHADDIVELFHNLLDNALKFRKKDVVPRVSVSARRQKGKWVFGVHDNGIGIEPEFFDRIFVIFQRLHRREIYPGTGISLSICRKLSRSMADESGSIRRSERVPHFILRSPSERKTKMPETLGRSLKILLVEDNLADADLMREALEEFCQPNDIYVARDGYEALDFLYRRGDFADAPVPDLILLDLNLPKKDGREVLAEIKSDTDLKSIPVIVITTSKAEEDVAKSYSLHANCYLEKPSNLDELFDVVKRIDAFWCEAVRLPLKR